MAGADSARSLRGRRREDGAPPPAHHAPPPVQLHSDPAEPESVPACPAPPRGGSHRAGAPEDRKSTRLNSSHLVISYAVFCLKKKKTTTSRSTRRSSPTTAGCGAPPPPPASAAPAATSLLPRCCLVS